MTSHRAFLTFALAGLSFAAVSLPATAHAQERIEGTNLGTAMYPVEVDVHFTFGAENVYGTNGVGAGARVSIPLVAGMLGRRVSDNLALSLGGDFLHYDNCYYSERCGANYVMVPVAAQWNLFFGRRISIFGEAGAFLYKGFFDGCLPGDVNCSAPSDFGVLPTVAVGARIHISPNVALTARVGYPTMTLGLSFL